MDGVLVGALGAAAAVAALLAWLLLARPESLAALLVANVEGDPAAWARRHPALLRAIQWVAIGITALLGFLTGLTLAFLGGTG